MVARRDAVVVRSDGEVVTARRVLVAEVEKPRDYEPLAAVLRHVRTWSDAAIANDLDSALDVVAPKDRPVIQRYADARKASKGWNPRGEIVRTSRGKERFYPSNDSRTLFSEKDAAKASSCARCGTPFIPRRATAKYCSDTCRKAASRA